MINYFNKISSKQLFKSCSILLLSAVMSSPLVSLQCLGAPVNMPEISNDMSTHMALSKFFIARKDVNRIMLFEVNGSEVNEKWGDSGDFDHLAPLDDNYVEAEVGITRQIILWTPDKATIGTIFNYAIQGMKVDQAATLASISNTIADLPIDTRGGSVVDQCEKPYTMTTKVMDKSFDTHSGLSINIDDMSAALVIDIDWKPACRKQISLGFSDGITINSSGDTIKLDRRKLKFRVHLESEDIPLYTCNRFNCVGNELYKQVIGNKLKAMISGVGESKYGEYRSVYEDSANVTVQYVSIDYASLGPADPSYTYRLEAIQRSPQGFEIDNHFILARAASISMEENMDFGTVNFLYDPNDTTERVVDLLIDEDASTYEVPSFSRRNKDGSLYTKNVQKDDVAARPAQFLVRGFLAQKYLLTCEGKDLSDGGSVAFLKNKSLKYAFDPTKQGTLQHIVAKYKFAKYKYDGKYDDSYTLRIFLGGRLKYNRSLEGDAYMNCSLTVFVL